MSVPELMERWRHSELKSRNGDQIEILSSSDGTPSPTWEQLVVTGKARARIRRYVREERRHEFKNWAKQCLTALFTTLDIFRLQEPSRKVLGEFNAASMSELVAMVGSGDISVPDVVTALVPEGFPLRREAESGMGYFNVPIGSL